nr:Gfo/Idh/MocA family oxidoreductase [Paenibacillus mangrovi]
MVDHTFLFTGAVQTIKQLIDEKRLGEMYYYDSVRVNLGLFQQDVNVIWDLAPHDLSIMDYILGSKPQAISAVGKSHYATGLEDIAYLTVYYENNMIAHIHVNWLSPVKIRQTLIGGSHSMIVWNDLLSDESLKIYNRGVDMIQSVESKYHYLASYRMGEMHAPVVHKKEALLQEIDYLVECIENNRQPMNDASSGTRIVRMLEASDASLKQSGAPIQL